MGIMNKFFSSDDGVLRRVPGALSATDPTGRVVYNMLDPWMQKFMGQCVGALKKAGIRAKGTGQFSIRLGEEGNKELQLDGFWSRYAKSSNAFEFDEVVAKAKKLLEE